MAHSSNPNKLARRAFLLGGTALAIAHKASGFEHPVAPGVVDKQAAWQRICRVTDPHNVGGYVGFDHGDVELIMGSRYLCAVEGLTVGNTRATEAVEQALERYHLNFRKPVTHALLIIAAPMDSWYSLESHRAYATFLHACAQSQLLRGGTSTLGVYREATLNDAFRVTVVTAATGREI